MVERRQSSRVLVALFCAIHLIIISSHKSLVQAQDVLRQRAGQPQPARPQSNPGGLDLSQIANIQLPPQLASLTPQQIHQLAQIREIQIQQQQRQQQQAQGAANGGQNDQLPNQNTAAPQPTTSQPVASNPQASSGSGNDDGSYNESGTEMEGVTSARSTNEVAGGSQASSGSSSGQQPTFEVNWNKCPQLEPSETEKNKKTQVITKCLQSAPIPTNLTRENVEAHREQIATCALKIEGWFDEQSNYKYEKAESEIRAKKLEPQIEIQVLKFHVACKSEALNKFPRDQHKLIEQVQFYQACMDYYISIVCEIEVSVDQ